MQTKHPDAGFMRMQTHINERMRAILMDWLVDVHLKYRQSTETLHLTASLVDRYLSRVPVPRAKLQLIGVAAMLICTWRMRLLSLLAFSCPHCCAAALTSTLSGSRARVLQTT